MRGSDLRFYADPTDMNELLDAFRHIASLIYTKDVSEVDARPVQLTDPRELAKYLHVGPKRPTSIFLITKAGDRIVQRSINMQDGSGIKISSDQLFNPHAIMIRLGGQFDGDRTLTAMSVNTTGETSEAKELFKAFKNVVVRNATYIQGFYVLPGAMEKWEDGWRLTPEAQNSPVLDLKRP